MRVGKHPITVHQYGNGTCDLSAFTRCTVWDSITTLQAATSARTLEDIKIELYLLTLSCFTNVNNLMAIKIPVNGCHDHLLCLLYYLTHKREERSISHISFYLTNLKAKNRPPFHIPRLVLVDTAFVALVAVYDLLLAPLQAEVYCSQEDDNHRCKNKPCKTRFQNPFVLLQPGGLQRSVISKRKERNDLNNNSGFLSCTLYPKSLIYTMQCS